MDYQNSSGDISNYYPNFIVKKSERETYIVETKVLEDLDVPMKIDRLKQWCDDINSIQSKIRYDWIFVDEESFHEYRPRTFSNLVKLFVKYKD